MFIVGKLLRAKIAREQSQTPSTATTAPATTTTTSATKASKPCWLCGLDASCNFQLVEDFPLCHGCFQLSFATFILPSLKKGAIGVPLAEALVAHVAREQKQSPEERLLHVQSHMAVRKASGKRGEPWDCPSCTLINDADEATCAVCGAASPRSVKCVHCRQPCAAETGELSVCSVAKRQHEVWECDCCTVVNTIAAETCPVCERQRLWSCDVCAHPNRSKPGRNGEKFCSACGAMAMTASVRRLFQEELAKERERQRQLEVEKTRLFARLHALGVEPRFQMGDGNCQFRALSHQLLGSNDHHMLVRHVIVEHIARNASAYSAYFENSAELGVYIERMRRSGTWGDELTLKACSEVFGVHVHVISSEESNWHIHYRPPEALAAAMSGASATVRGVVAAAAMTTAKSGDDVAAWPEEAPHVFVAYANRVHYDDICTPPPLPEIGRSLVAALSRAQAEEEEWDEALPPGADGQFAVSAETTTAILMCRETTGESAGWVEVRNDKKPGV